MRILRDVTHFTVTDAGILRYSATTKWPSVSEWIVRRVVEELDRYNVLASQQRASEERRFVEARLQAQRQLVANAEDRLSAFLQTNRQFQNSPELTFLYERLHREVSLQQQVLVNLSQANEDARIREVRDVRTTTIIDAPHRPTTPDRRGRVKRALLGLIAGTFIGAALVLLSELLARQTAAGDPGAQRLSFMTQQFRRRLRFLRVQRS